MACAMGLSRGLASKQTTFQQHGNTNMVLMDAAEIAAFDFGAIPTNLSFTSTYSPEVGQVVYTLPELQQLNKQQIRVILVDMLRREEELRLSTPCQTMFGKIGEQHHHFNDFVSRLQAHVSLEFQVDPQVGVELIRSAVSLYPEDDEIKSIPHYVRHNRCKAGHLKPGDLPPDVAITDVEGNPQRLSSMLETDKPVVLLGASYS
jgi:hypothetical protein